MPIKINSPLFRFSLFAWIIFILVFVIENLNGRFWLNDFKVYYYAADAMTHGAQFYGTPFGLDSGIYKYSPFTLFLFAPSGLVSFKAACILHFIFLSACTWLSFLLLSVILKNHVFREKIPNEGLMLSLAFVGICLHLVKELHLGNINAFLLLLSCLVLICILQSRKVPAGILFGLIILFKPYFIFLLIPLFLRGKWKVIVSMSLTLVAGIILPAIFFGITENVRIHEAWLRTVFSHNEGYESFQSLFSVIQNNILPAIPGYYQYFVFLAGGLCAVLLVIYNLNRERKEPASHLVSSDFAMEWFILLAAIPNLVKTDTEHFMATAPLLVFLFYFLSLDKRAVPAIILMILIFFYGGNSTDLLGRELSDILFRAGLTGISNLLIMIMSVVVYYRFVRNEPVLVRSG